MYYVYTYIRSLDYLIFLLQDQTQLENIQCQYTQHVMTITSVEGTHYQITY